MRSLKQTPRATGGSKSKWLLPASPACVSVCLKWNVFFCQSVMSPPPAPSIFSPPVSEHSLLLLLSFRRQRDCCLNGNFCKLTPPPQVSDLYRNSLPFEISYTNIFGGCFSPPPPFLRTLLSVMRRCGADIHHDYLPFRAKTSHVKVPAPNWEIK